MYNFQKGEAQLKLAIKEQKEIIEKVTCRVLTLESQLKELKTKQIIRSPAHIHNHKINTTNTSLTYVPFHR